MDITTKDELSSEIFKKNLLEINRKLNRFRSNLRGKFQRINTFEQYEFEKGNTCIVSQDGIILKERNFDLYEENNDIYIRFINDNTSKHFKIKIIKPGYQLKFNSKYDPKPLHFKAYDKKTEKEIFDLKEIISL